MQFRTELTIPRSEDKYSKGFKFLTIGSCFSDVIGQRLHEYKLDTLVNPFGTIFNPVSQFELIEAALAPHEQEELPMTEQNGRWYAYGFHSSFSAPTREELQVRIDEMLQIVKSHLAETNVVFFTFGTALVYQLASTDRIVANCHKMPAQNFNRRLLLAEEIVAGFAQTFALLKQFNPGIKAVLTVSPVRHVKETLPLNSVSKSVLRVACHYLAELMPDVQYFPAYELLIDDLRDYRFYKDDLLHPSAMAEQYVWEKFSETYFDNELKQFTKEWESVLQALHHKPFNAGSTAHQDFLRNLLSRLEAFNKTVNCTPEIDLVKKQLLPYKKQKLSKKAPKELVDLLAALASSDVMTDAVPKSHKPVAGKEEEPASFVSAPQEAPVITPEAAPESHEPAISASEEIPVAEANENLLPAMGKKDRVSKSKKRRDKRKAKLQASRDEIPAVAPNQNLQTETTTSDQTLYPAATKAQKLAPKRDRKQKAEKTKPMAGQVTESTQTAGNLPIAEVNQPVSGKPEKSKKPTKGRKKVDLLPESNQHDQKETKSPTTLTEEVNAPQNITGAPDKPQTQPALAGVGALLNALAVAQAPGKSQRGRPAKKIIPAPLAAEPENNGVAAQTQAPVTKKNNRSRKAERLSSESQATSFPGPETKPMPAPEAPQVVVQPAREQKSKDTKRESGGSKKGKAKRVVLKKSAPSKNNNQ